MQDEPPPSHYPFEPTEKRWDTPITPCHQDSDCLTPNHEAERDVVAECVHIYLASNWDETEFWYGMACMVHVKANCPGPDIAVENLNYENTSFAFY